MPPIDKHTVGTVHSAGPVVVCQGRYLQRCVTCGAKLCDEVVYEGVGYLPNLPGTFPPNTLVHEAENRELTLYIPDRKRYEAEDTLLPVNYCIHLVEPDLVAAD